MSRQIWLKKGILPALLLSLASGTTFASTIIYSEDFTGQEGKGIDGTGAFDFSGVDWSVQLVPNDPNHLANEDDYVKVVNRGSSNQVLESRDTRGEDLTGMAYWKSPVFNITDNPFNEDLLFSMDIWALGILEPQPEDYIAVSYILDGNEVLITTIFDNFNPDPTPDPTHLRTWIPSGNTLQIIAEFQTGRGDAERHAIDNILVRVPEPTTLALLGIGLAGIGYKRKKIA